MLLALGCGPTARGARDGTTSKAVTKPGMEVHAASGRPRLIVVRRDGDPSAAIAVEIAGADGFELALVGAAVGARLEAAAFTGVEVTTGDRLARVRALVPQLGAPVSKQLDAALQTPIGKDDASLPALRRAVDAYAARPVLDPALERAVRCLDRPTRPSGFKPPDDLAAAAEKARLARVRADTVIVGAVGSGNVDAFSSAWRTAPVLAGSILAPPATDAAPRESVTLSLAHEGGVVVIEGGPRAALPAALSALTDPDGPLALRLRAADDFRVRGVSGAARGAGACLVIEVEPSPHARVKDPERFAMRAAVAMEVARQESELALDVAKATDDGDAARAAIASGGDPREAADRAAWWSWPLSPPSPLVSAATLSLPAATLAKSPQTDVEGSLAALGPKFSVALQKAKLAWTKSEIDLRRHVEVGQGELWVALGTPCSVAHEGTSDAGLAAVAVRALAPAHAVDGVTVEPWSSTTGVGLVAHAAPRSGESAQRLAHRVGDVVGRTFLASFPHVDDLVRARADSLVTFSAAQPGADLIRSALRAESPLHPSWLDPPGTLEAVAKASIDGVDLRLATIRSGPLRLSVLANVDDAQNDAAARAAERWLPRRPGEARACPIADAGLAPKGAILPLTVKAGTGVALAFPVDDSAREQALHLAAVLDGSNGRIAVELAGLGTRFEARLVRGVARHALVLLVLAPEPNLDAVVGKLRALLEKLRGAGIEAADLARADRDRAAARATRRLEPRARVVDLFSGELLAAPAPMDLTQLRAAAAKILDEDRAQLVVARLPKQ